MVLEIIKLANDSQGLAVWILVLLMVAAWLKINHKIAGVQQYIKLQFRLMDQKIDTTREHLDLVRSEVKK